MRRSSRLLAARATVAAALLLSAVAFVSQCEPLEYLRSRPAISQNARAGVHTHAAQRAFNFFQAPRTRSICGAGRDGIRPRGLYGDDVRERDGKRVTGGPDVWDPVFEEKGYALPADYTDIPPVLRGEEALEAARSSNKDMWVFAYSEDMWAPSYESSIVESRHGWTKGFLRRMWGVSTKNYGTPEAPGLQLTLVRDRGAFVWGKLYRVAEGDKDKVIAAMGEKAEEGEVPQLQSFGFAKNSSEGGGITEGMALTYVMDEKSASFKVNDNTAEIAQSMLESVGSSSSNIAYLVDLFNVIGDIPGYDRTLGFLIDQHLNDIVESLPAAYRRQQGMQIRTTKIKGFEEAKKKSFFNF